MTSINNCHITLDQSSYFNVTISNDQIAFYGFPFWNDNFLIFFINVYLSAIRTDRNGITLMRPPFTIK